MSDTNNPFPASIGSNHETKIRIEEFNAKGAQGPVGNNSGTFNQSWTTINNPTPNIQVRALHPLRANRAEFTGRRHEIDEIVTEIKHRSAQGRFESIINIIVGMGGIGKTELAIAISHELKDLFPDAQLFQLDLRKACKN